MDHMDDGVSVVKLDNGKWVWICEPGNGGFFQAGEQFKTKAAALKAGRQFAEEAFASL